MGRIGSPRVTAGHVRKVIVKNVKSYESFPSREIVEGEERG